MGADLAAWFSTSPHVERLVTQGRASQDKAAHWYACAALRVREESSRCLLVRRDCGFSDVTLGYALATANVTLTLVVVPVRPLTTPACADPHVPCCGSFAR